MIGLANMRWQGYGDTQGEHFVLVRIQGSRIGQSTRLVIIGQYYDNTKNWQVSTDCALAFIFNCKRQFRKPDNCRKYVEKILLDWLTSSMIQVKNLSNEDWKLLNNRMAEEKIDVLYPDKKLLQAAFNIPFKNIPTMVNKIAHPLTKCVFKFRLEKGI